MRNQNAKKFLKATLIRAIRTAAQVALGMVTVGMTMKEINWVELVSVSVVAMLYSVLTSVATGLPETKSDGQFLIDDSDDEKTFWTLEYNGDPEKLKSGDTVTFLVTTEIGGNDDAALG